MSLSFQEIQEKLTKQFSNEVSVFQESFGILEFEASKEYSLKILTYLYDEKELQFQFLSDLTAVHYPDKKGQELQVVYHLHQLQQNIRIRMKVNIPIQKPEVFSAATLFAAANWMERETYDFFGIIFVGHPNLIRILNVEEMDYFPLRKEYPLEDNSRLDKDDEMFGRNKAVIAKS